MPLDLILTSGPFREHFKTQPHEDRLYRKMDQPSGDAILEHNNELRKNPGAISDLTFGRHMLSIPLADWEMLKRKYPVLAHGDVESQRRFMNAFIRSSESIPYRVQG